MPQVTKPNLQRNSGGVTEVPEQSVITNSTNIVMHNACLRAVAAEGAVELLADCETFTG
jgi:hypothetical protein